AIGSSRSVTRAVRPRRPGRRARRRAAAQAVGPQTEGVVIAGALLTGAADASASRRHRLWSAGLSYGTIANTRTVLATAHHRPGTGTLAIAWIGAHLPVGALEAAAETSHAAGITERGGRRTGEGSARGAGRCRR